MSTRIFLDKHFVIRLPEPSLSGSRLAHNNGDEDRIIPVASRLQNFHILIDASSLRSNVYMKHFAYNNTNAVPKNKREREREKRIAGDRLLLQWACVMH